MRSLRQQLRELREAGESVVLATVVGAKGATPRDIGARMLVTADGAVAGSVGGGCGEAQVRDDALRALGSGIAATSEIDLTGPMDDESLTHCGGRMEVFLEPLRWEASAAVGLAPAAAERAIEGALGASQRIARAVTIAGGPGVPAGAHWLVTAHGDLLGALPLGPGFDTLVRESGQRAIADGACRRLGLHRAEAGWVSASAGPDAVLFVEPVVPPPELIVVGAGHIARPLATLGRLLDFAVTVIDDRAEFATRARFPDADTIAVGAVDAELRRRGPGLDSYVVLVTRDHQHDEAALRAVLGAPTAYVGMIGSRRRVREVFRHLSEAGVPAAQLERVHAPIGLRIGAETPAEIALSIAAEIVQVRHGARAATAAARDGAA